MVLMTTSDLPLKRIARGKVRDVYEVDGDRLLLVATDRVSAYDVVMAEPIPMKGAVLTQTSAWWFRQLEGVVQHHMISADADEIIAAVPALKPHRAEIAGRAMLCRRGTVFPIECVVRGYLSGSAWREYAKQGTLAGETLPAGLKESGRLDPPIFSPATKAESGHDENITVGRMAEVLGKDVTAELERLTRVVYTKGRDVALKQGIIIADTKFEFGRTQGGRDPADRRGHDARQLALLAARRLRAGQAAAQLRQAAAARLARCRAPCRPLERRCAARPSCRPRWSMPPASATSKPIAA